MGLLIGAILAFPARPSIGSAATYIVEVAIEADVNEVAAQVARRTGGTITHVYRTVIHIQMNLTNLFYQTMRRQAKVTKYLTKPMQTIPEKRILCRTTGRRLGNIEIKGG